MPEARRGSQGMPEARRGSQGMPDARRGSQGPEHQEGGGGGGGERREPLTFLSLKDHLVELVIKGLLSERDAHNKQLLLHALNVIILDIGY